MQADSKITIAFGGRADVLMQRQAGFEQGGVCCGIDVQIDEIADLVDQASVDVKDVGDELDAATVISSGIDGHGYVGSQRREIDRVPAKWTLEL